MPASAYRQGTGVVLMHPVMMRQVSFKAVSTSLVCRDRLQLEQAYSAVEKHRAMAVVRIVVGSAPHLEFTSLRRMLFRVLTSALVLELQMLFEG